MSELTAPVVRPGIPELIASWPQFGAPAGLCLANVAVLFFSWVSGDQFLAWGWRIPFALSIIMVGIGLYIRLGIFETPVFSRILAEAQVARAPSLEVLKRQPKEVILTALARMGEQAPGFVYTAYIFTFGTTVLAVSRDFLLTAVSSGSFQAILQTVPEPATLSLFGLLSIVLVIQRRRSLRKNGALGV